MRWTASSWRFSIWAQIGCKPESSARAKRARPSAAALVAADVMKSLRFMADKDNEKPDWLSIGRCIRGNASKNRLCGKLLRLARSPHEKPLRAFGLRMIKKRSRCNRDTERGRMI